MKKLKSLINYFSTAELIIWSCSVIITIISFLLFDRQDYLKLSASLIGVTSLIFNAKGNPIAQVLIIIFSVLYGIISFSYGYYGEMITYLFMSAPMAVISLISWLRHPFGGKRSEVEINRIRKREYPFMLLLTFAVTFIFYFLLKALNTQNLIISTFSVATSFAAVYLTFRRSPYFAIAYGLNDIVLILLWSFAAFEDISYIGVIACFAAFLANDIYGFISWKSMQKSQAVQKQSA